MRPINMPPFRVGEKVKCVIRDGLDNHPPDRCLTVSRVYRSPYNRCWMCGIEGINGLWLAYRFRRLQNEAD